ncbi:Nitrogen regulatory protein P-II [Thalassovita mediterranea]|uniref:Nitrogen regulatory protein P-II n=1 Tax=Thalassovita mediterranea TaxID=340021 RepID=A0A0P1GRK2_9RHOB|nr:Nitrogen regulatory protein P-II [Thalassovita mediterranea]SIS30789.1 nitrogen regulatory protein P-II family [Thalassovita mediterranea]
MRNAVAEFLCSCSISFTQHPTLLLVEPVLSRDSTPYLSVAPPLEFDRLLKGNKVKLIIATIKPFKLEEVREALTEIGVRGMMVTEIKGFGSQSGHTEIYRGAEYAVNFVPKIKLEIVVSAAMVDQTVETITNTARTGKIGDGKIFVLDVAQAVRVRTGETNDDAI